MFGKPLASALQTVDKTAGAGKTQAKGLSAKKNERDIADFDYTTTCQYCLLQTYDSFMWLVEQHNSSNDSQAIDYFLFHKFNSTEDTSHKELTWNFTWDNSYLDRKCQTGTNFSCWSRSYPADPESILNQSSNLSLNILAL